MWIKHWQEAQSVLYIDDFKNCMGKNFDKMKMIYKAITRSSSNAFWWERIIVLCSKEMIV